MGRISSKGTTGKFKRDQDGKGPAPRLVLVPACRADNDDNDEGRRLRRPVCDTGITMKVALIGAALLVLGVGGYAYYSMCGGFNSCQNPSCVQDCYENGVRVR